MECEYSFDGVNWLHAPDGKFTVIGDRAVRVRFAGKSAPVPHPPAQASDEPMPFPPMPLPVVKHAVVGDLFDRLAMQMYALRYADLVVAATPRATADAERDAARHQWHRKPGNHFWLMGHARWSSPEEFDKAIDSAMVTKP